MTATDASAPFVPPTPEEALAGLRMPLEDAMRTQRAVRRLHLDPVSMDVLLPLLELALKAPTSSNSQDWTFMVVEAPEQKAELERAQAAIRDQVARDERDRIARELHDILAHSLSAMSVQAAAAQDLIHADPGRAEVIIGQVSSTGRRALSETAHLLRALRDGDDELGMTPAPGLDQISELVEQFRDEGLRVDVE